MKETVTLVLNQDGTMRFSSTRISWLDARRWAEHGCQVFRFERDGDDGRVVYVNAPALMACAAPLNPATGEPITAPPVTILTAAEARVLENFDRKKET